MCVCIGEGVIDVCDPNSTLPDCTANGCGNALTATDSCGVLFRECNNPLTGVVDGTCKDGGCSCDELSDCQDTGLNVDSCVILVDGGQCVCDGYEIGGDRAPCPLALECVATGCVYDGAPYATDVLLYAAVGVR